MNKMINIDFFRQKQLFLLCSNDKLGQMKRFSWTQLKFWLFLFSEKSFASETILWFYEVLFEAAKTISISNLYGYENYLLPRPSF